MMAVRSRTSDPWRLACPEGHRTIRRVRNSHYRGDGVQRWRCGTCRDTYQKVTDLRTGEEVTP